MQILMIGCGNMGHSLLKQWSNVSDVSFTVVDPNAAITIPGVTSAKSISDLPAKTYDGVVVAIKPQMIDAIMPDYTGFLADSGVVISIAAGYSAERLSALMGDKPVIRVMPNMPTGIGKGVSGLFASSNVIEQQRQLVRRIMAPTGELVEASDEDHLDRVTAVAGSGPGYVFEIARAYVDAAESMGFDHSAARRMVLSTLSGAVQMAIESDESLFDLRNSVTSKAGTTEAGLSALNGDGMMSERMVRTINAAYERAVEMR